MARIDVVIVSDGSTKKHPQRKEVDFSKVTQTAIDTAKQDEGVNVIVVEGNKNITYKNAETLHYDFEFNYNRCLNYGASKGNAPYIAFCNNDLEFTKGWTEIIDHMIQHRSESASPIDPRTANEYRIRQHKGIIRGTQVRRLFCGWCFIWTRNLWEKYPHDERRKFWTADNASAVTLRKKGVRHFLDTDIEVRHIQSLTLQTLSKEKHDELTFEEVAYFNHDYNQKIFNKKPKRRNG